MNKNEPELSAKELWTIYHKCRENGGGEFYRNKLIECYQELLERIAKKVREELPRHIELDDLIGYGVFGLIDSIEKYDKSRGEFNTYAYPRIRGFILNGIRNSERIPKFIKLRKKQVDKATEKLGFKLIRKPTDKELIEELSNDNIYQSNPENSKKPFKFKGIEKAERIIKDAKNLKRLFYQSELEENSIELIGKKENDPYTIAQKKDLIEFLQKESTREEKLILNLYHYNFYWMEDKEKKGVPWEEMAKIIGYKSGGSLWKKYKKILEKLKSKLINKGFDLEYCLENL